MRTLRVRLDHLSTGSQPSCGKGFFFFCPWPSTKQTQEMLFNLEQSDPKTDLWLRDSDVIEVPGKEIM